MTRDCDSVVCRSPNASRTLSAALPPLAAQCASPRKNMSSWPPHSASRASRLGPTHTAEVPAQFLATPLSAAATTGFQIHQFDALWQCMPCRKNAGVASGRLMRAFARFTSARYLISLPVPVTPPHRWYTLEARRNLRHPLFLFPPLLLPRPSTPCWKA